jgi:hypothetical protein
VHLLKETVNFAIERLIVMIAMAFISGTGKASKFSRQRLVVFGSSSFSERIRAQDDR